MEGERWAAAALTRAAAASAEVAGKSVAEGSVSLQPVVGGPEGVGLSARQGGDALAKEARQSAARETWWGWGEEEAWQGVDGGDGAIVVGVAEGGGEEGGEDGVNNRKAGGGDGVDGLAVDLVELDRVGSDGGEEGGVGRV